MQVVIDMGWMTVLEEWRSISNPDRYELVVELPAGTAPGIGDEIEVVNVGPCVVRGAWRATKYKSQTVSGPSIVVRLDVELVL
jgi:hypothetical protein